jgi:hypothetical protein
LAPESRLAGVGRSILIGRLPRPRVGNLSDLEALGQQNNFLAVRVDGRFAAITLRASTARSRLTGRWPKSSRPLRRPHGRRPRARLPGA